MKHHECTILFHYRKQNQFLRQAGQCGGPITSFIYSTRYNIPTEPFTGSTRDCQVNYCIYDQALDRADIEMPPKHWFASSTEDWVVEERMAGLQKVCSCGCMAALILLFVP